MSTVLQIGKPVTPHSARGAFNLMWTKTSDPMGARPAGEEVKEPAYIDYDDREKYISNATKAIHKSIYVNLIRILNRFDMTNERCTISVFNYIAQLGQ